jgi:hypothetical protein
MTTAKMKKRAVARTVSYPVTVKPAYVERIDQKKNTKYRREDIRYWKVLPSK